MKIHQGSVLLLLVTWLTPLTQPEPHSGGQRGIDSAERKSRDGQEKCPKLRFRRRGCKSRYECENVCEEKVVCRTKYEYKCTDYRRQKCSDVWQNQCNGKRGGRSVRSSVKTKSNKRPFWLDTEVVFDTANYPLPPSDVPLASPSKGQIFNFASPPKSKSCWQKVRQCKWVNYKSTCGKKPVKTCDDKPSTQCKKKCKNVYYCDKCPSKVTTPRPTRPTRPTTACPAPRPTRPTRPTPRPTKRPVGPPAPPKPGTFIISPPAPPNKFDVIIDARKRRMNKKKKNMPFNLIDYQLTKKYEVSFKFG